MNVRSLFWPVQGGKPFFADVPCTEPLVAPCGHTFRKVPPRVQISTCGCPLDAAQRTGRYRLIGLRDEGDHATPLPVYLEAVEVGVN